MGPVSIPWQTDGSWNQNYARFVTGDFNGDGYSDIVGIYEYPGSNPAIKMWIFAGRSNATTSSPVGPVSIPWKTDGSWNGGNARFLSGAGK